ncbi:hypothetical protein [Streptomyces sp. NPDC018000]|uniref:hypothetical protein n=1 Tax=Streptomyces sp. NPDC018000 TaxID=3365028 RepID=UPI00379C034B
MNEAEETPNAAGEGAAPHTTRGGGSSLPGGEEAVAAGAACQVPADSTVLLRGHRVATAVSVGAARLLPAGSR